MHRVVEQGAAIRPRAASHVSPLRRQAAAAVPSSPRCPHRMGGPSPQRRRSPATVPRSTRCPKRMAGRRASAGPESVPSTRYRAPVPDTWWSRWCVRRCSPQPRCRRPGAYPAVAWGLRAGRRSRLPVTARCRSGPTSARTISLLPVTIGNETVKPRPGPCGTPAGGVRKEARSFVLLGSAALRSSIMTWRTTVVSPRAMASSSMANSAV